MFLALFLKKGFDVSCLIVAEEKFFRQRFFANAAKFLAAAVYDGTAMRAPGGLRLHSHTGESAGAVLLLDLQRALLYLAQNCAHAPIDARTTPFVALQICNYFRTGLNKEVSLTSFT